MELTIVQPLIISVVFGAVVSVLYHLILGTLTWRNWGAWAWLLACLCYIILFGVIRV
jgi:hypothetical protein